MTLVTILVKRGCHHCEGAIDHIDQLAQDHDLPVAGLDLDEHDHIAEELRIDDHPAVRFDEGPVFAGVPDQETFATLARTGGAR